MTRSDRKVSWLSPEYLDHADFLLKGIQADSNKNRWRSPSLCRGLLLSAPAQEQYPTASGGRSLTKNKHALK